MLRSLCLPMLCACAAWAQDGAAIYKRHCAACHDAPAGRVPPTSALRAMSPEQILRSLESGVMKAQGEGLRSAEKHAIMIYLSSPAPKAGAPLVSTAFCGGGNQQPGAWLEGPHWNGWGVDAANTRYQEAGGLTAGDVGKLKLKWAFGLGDSIVARAQPTIAGGRVYVGSEAGAVYSLDAGKGCIYWTFAADGAVTSAIVLGPAGSSAKQTAACFGDQKGNEYAVDSATGKLRWRVHADDHFAARITAAAQLHAGVLYVPAASFEEPLALSPTYECCTFRGSLAALDAATGKLLWKTYMIAQAAQATKKSKTGAQMYGPSGASVWSAPTFDEKHDVLYVATGNNYSDPPTVTSDAVIALDAKTGKILWSRQLTPNDANNSGCSTPFKTNCPDADGPDFDFGQPPILVSLDNGNRALVIGQKSGMAYGLDPDRQGEVLWQRRVGQGGVLGGIQWGSAADHEKMYVAVSDLQITGIVPDSTSAQGYRLVVNSKKGGGLFALRLATGEKVWEAKPAPCGERERCSPAQSAAVTAIPGVVFSGSVDGHLRAYSSSTGEVIWDVDTAREYETVNGMKARGGSLDGPGPTIAGGMLYVNSGYGQWGGMPGNVLLAYGK
jgi:polyvinyl alcohol dehydrogenase (cytochrome)